MSPLVLGLVAGGLGLGAMHSASVSANASEEANQKAEQTMAEQQAKNEQWWQAKQNENYLNSAEAQAAITKARDMAREQMANARGTQAVMGGTDASIAAAQQNANKMLSDTMSGIAAQATARRDMAEQTYLNQNNALAQSLIGHYKEQAAQNAAAGSQALGALSGIGSSLITAFGGSGA